MKRTMLIVLGTLTCLSMPFAVQRVSANADGSSNSLDFPVGDFRCTGNLMATAKQPGHATAAHLHIEKVLGGHWFAIHYEEEKTPANDQPYEVEQYIGSDSSGKRVVSATMDNTGSGYSVGSSPGWNGNVMTVDESDPTGKGVEYRDTFTRGADEIAHTGTLRDKNKQWVKTDEETCHRS